MPWSRAPPCPGEQRGRLRAQCWWAGGEWLGREHLSYPLALFRQLGGNISFYRGLFLGSPPPLIQSPRNLKSVKGKLLSAESGVILSMLRKSWRRRAFPSQGEEQTHWMHSQKAGREPGYAGHCLWDFGSVIHLSEPQFLHLKMDNVILSLSFLSSIHSFSNSY